MRTSVLPHLPKRNHNTFTFTVKLVDSNRNLPEVRSTSLETVEEAWAEQVKAMPPTINNVRPRGKRNINDSYCVNCVVGKRNRVHVTGKLNSLSVKTKIARQKDCLFVTTKRKTVNFLPVNSCVVTHVPFAGRLLQKKGVNPDIVHHPEIKYVNDVSCVDHLSSVKNITNVPIVAIVPNSG